ncbi:MAG: hypothetical protein KR126chlam3_00520 [Chlamydiae bacterium]|nr:hypothetical protein [Chlamydiota bacterium]
MRKVFLRLLCLFFIALSSSAIAQEEKEPQKQEEQQVEKPADKDFFDIAEAPVSYKGAFMKMMLTLLGLIVLIVISVWMLRRVSHGRMKQMNLGRAMKVIERRPLSAKTVLYLVEISGKKVVIAESQVEVRGITTADHLTPEE